MGNLVFAIRCADGLVLASDTSYHLQAEKNPSMVKVEERLAVLVEPDVNFGRNLLQSYLPSAKKPVESVHSLAQACSEHCKKECSGKEIPITGLIFAGIDPGEKGRVELRGIHASRMFDVIGFAGNVFGGMNSIARFIDRKIYTPNMTVNQAKILAAFYVFQSQLALHNRLDEYIGMATITYPGGLQWAEKEEMAEIMSRVIGLSLDLKSRLTFLFTESR
ncbi:MAG TPA: hypothetical protein G4O03_04250 [Dehalococcoidia bacterium]|nr:hypothetical protein [Dehalococcoidia bacterium]